MTLEPSGSAVGPRVGPLNVTVRVQRKGYDGDIPFAVVGLPPGLRAQDYLLVRQGTSEFTLILTPTEGGVFAHRNPGQQGPDSFVLTVVNGREGDGMQMCSPPVSIIITTL